MITENQLLPCPFCGEEPHDAHHIEYGRWAVTCRCGVHGTSASAGPNATDELKIKAYSDARAAWNRRAALTQPAQPAEGGEAVAYNYKQAPGSKNCMQCCVAYMLGLPVDSVRDFERESHEGVPAWESMEAFFESHGFTAEMFPPTVEILGDYLASGTTDRGTSHMVVMRGGKLLHDPHPSNAGLEFVQAVWIIARKAVRTAPPASHVPEADFGNNQPASQEPVCPVKLTVAEARKWRIVPLEPTKGMLIAGNHCQPGDYSAKLVWDEMLKAADRSGELDYTRPLLQQCQPASQEQADTVPLARFNELLMQEHALSHAYVRLRHILGAMDPPRGSDAKAVWAYVEGVAQQKVAASQEQAQQPSPTAGMNLGQRIQHVGGRENAQGYIEFGSVAAVRALVHHVIRDLPKPNLDDGDITGVAGPLPETGWDEWPTKAQQPSGVTLPSEFERAFPTSRRMAAVQKLIDLGWSWDGSAWQQPSGGEVVAWRWMPSHVYPQWVYSDNPARVADAKRFMGEGGVQPLTLATPKPQSSGGEVKAAPVESYPAQDQAFYAFWYSHMLDDLMQPPLAGISHSTARYIWDSALATPKPEPMTWQPIETAPENTGGLAVVRWVDDDGQEHIELDCTEDGCWMRWHDHAEHVKVIGGHGVSYTPPYKEWLPLSAPTAHHGITKEQA